MTQISLKTNHSKEELAELLTIAYCSNVWVDTKKIANMDENFLRYTFSLLHPTLYMETNDTELLRVKNQLERYLIR